MSDESAKERLHSRLYPEGEDVWAIIRELAAPGKGGKAEGKKGELDKAEDERRRILRPHAEMRFGNDPESKGDREQRRRLDVALGALTVLEIAYETGVVKVEEERIPEPECLKVLIGSEAFLRYLNAYLYFGIRFLAGE